MNHENELALQTEIGTQRLPYQPPRLVSLGTVQSLVQGGVTTGSDGGATDCAAGGPFV
jgi:hypothetical protein